MELDTLGDRKTALFLIMSDTDTTFNFVIAMLQSQLFNLLCDKADDEYGGRLPVHVQCILDEFANIGQIPNFDKLIATIRSRKSRLLLFTVTVTAKDHLQGRRRYHCRQLRHYLVFGRQGEIHAQKSSRKSWGKRPLTVSTPQRTGDAGFHGLNYQKLGKELMSQDEIAVMDGGKCILQVRGTRPFLSDKFDITAHKITNTLPTPTRKMSLMWNGT